jgi:hypothetical protein
MIAAIYRVLRVVGDLRAIRRGPSAIGRRMVNRRAHRALSRAMRRGLP